MSTKGMMNLSAVMLSVITALLSFVTFVLSSFYSTAQAQWDDAKMFRERAEARLQTLEIDAKNQRASTAKDIEEIKFTLNQIVEVKLRREPGK